MVDDLLQWAHVETAGELWLLLFGVAGQVTFFSRWLLQWIASEARGVSHVPVPFWWLSLAGASALLVYFILRGEPVGVLGQSVGWIVYGRNLRLVYRNRARDAKIEAAVGGP